MLQCIRVFLGFLFLPFVDFHRLCFPKFFRLILFKLILFNYSKVICYNNGNTSRLCVMLIRKDYVM